jgi:hypothetical protein
MRAQYYQVIGSIPLTIDYPDGVVKAHRPGSVVKAAPSNRCVQRGLRTKQLRPMSDREMAALRAAEVAANQPRDLVVLLPDD